MSWRTFMVAASLVIVPAFAQDVQRFSVPFDFVAGAHHWTAGEYTVSPMPNGYVQIRSLDDKRSAFVGTIATGSDRESGNPRLVFHRYGDQYFLSEIWPSTLMGRALPTSNTERELAAKAKSTTTVAALRSK
jgi:hypothetical protein